MDQDDMQDFLKMLEGDDPAKAAARAAAVFTLLDVCSTEALVAMAKALDNPPQGLSGPAAVSLAALRQAGYRGRMH